MKKPFESLLARKQDDILVKDLWPKAVKARAGYRCEWSDKNGRCKKTGRLEAHHIIGKTNYDVRYDYRNGACLCFSHHYGTRDSAHEASHIFWEMMIEQRGLRWYEDLCKRASANNIKVNKVPFYEELKEKLLQLEGR